MNYQDDNRNGITLMSAEEIEEYYKRRKREKVEQIPTVEGTTMWREVIGKYPNRRTNTIAKVWFRENDDGSLDICAGKMSDNYMIRIDFKQLANALDIDLDY